MASCCCGESSSCCTVCRISQCSMEQINPDYPSVSSPPDQILRLASSANIIEIPFDRLSLRFYHQMLQEYFVARQPIKRNPFDLADLWSWPCLEKDMPLWEPPDLNTDLLPPPPKLGGKRLLYCRVSKIGGGF